MSGDRVIVVDEPEYIASYHIEDLGEGRKMTFVHLDVFYWGHSIYRDLLRKWEVWRQVVPCVLYTMATEESRAWEKFVQRLGFQYLTDVGCTDGKTRKMYVNLGPKKEAQEQE
jgi:hypothetical protein